MKVFIDYSVGPVQGFVAQSRRTRDLWGSSYLLSVLAGHAMLGAIRAGGEITRPQIDNDPLFLRISGDEKVSVPTLGSLPNRFQVEVDNQSDVSPVANAATEALYRAWNKVQQAVWQEFVEDVAPLGKDTDQIWDRQTSSFWEVSWTASPEKASSSLARRKLWRTHWLPHEPGDKCTVMHDFQELSGYSRARSTDEAKRQDEFWCRLRARLHSFDMRDDERLCSIALIKRMFPAIGDKALGWDIDTARWPSTAYVAAVPWIRSVLSRRPSSAEQYAVFVCQTVGSTAFREQSRAFIDLDTKALSGFGALDPNFLHESYIANSRECDLCAESRRALREKLRTLQQYKIDENAVVGVVPNYYALLLADGDRVGSLVSAIGGDTVGNGLAKFSRAIPDIVHSHDGVVIYGGGDDVLAMLPVPTALECAQRLSEAYRRAFVDFAQATLSIGVVFAQIRVPLTSVITEAHRLLTNDAKKTNGRNSLAVAVRNRGGFTCKWVTTWTRRLCGRHDELSCVDLVQGIVDRLYGNQLEPGVSTSLIYRLRELIAMLADQPKWVPGQRTSIPAELDGFKFVKAEVMRALADDTGDPDDRDNLAELLWNMLQVSGNQADDSDNNSITVVIDGLLLARFLATGGCEEDR